MSSLIYPAVESSNSVLNLINILLLIRKKNRFFYKRQDHLINQDINRRDFIRYANRSSDFWNTAEGSIHFHSRAQISDSEINVTRAKRDINNNSIEDLWFMCVIAAKKSFARTRKR